MSTPSLEFLAWDFPPGSKLWLKSQRLIRFVFWFEQDVTAGVGNVSTEPPLGFLRVTCANRLPCSQTHFAPKVKVAFVEGASLHNPICPPVNRTRTHVRFGSVQKLRMKTSNGPRWTTDGGETAARPGRTGSPCSGQPTFSRWTTGARPVGPSFAKCQRTLSELRPGAERSVRDFGAGVVEQRSALGLPKISLYEVALTSCTRLTEWCGVVLTVTCVNYKEWMERTSQVFKYREGWLS